MPKPADKQDYIDFEIRLMEPNEAEAVTALIVSGFNEFIAADYAPAGAAAIREYAKPDNLRARIAENCFVLVAADAEHQLMGMVEVEEYRHITLLFVDKEWHGQGAARALMEAAMELCRANRMACGDIIITLHASRYAAGFYEHLGFMPQGPEQVKNGRVYIPMAYTLKSPPEPKKN